MIRYEYTIIMDLDYRGSMKPDTPLLFIGKSTITGEDFVLSQSIDNQHEHIMEPIAVAISKGKTKEHSKTMIRRPQC